MASHSLWGVWVEILNPEKEIQDRVRHSLWGVWVEMSASFCFSGLDGVTPFGECGLK